MSSRICPNCGWGNKSEAKFCSQCGAILTSPVTLKPGTTLHNGRYVIDKQLGKGGMGATYLAKDTQAFDRPCVIKIMLPYFDLDDPDDFQLAIKRFEQEARALAELGTHPNIPNLLHWFEESGQFFLVMEFIEGENLKEKLHREGPQPPEQVIKWGISLCRILEFLASRGYVHHDIKPDNIILHAESGEPILVDFGTVKAGKLATKASFGTQGYAPPEQMMPPYQTEHRSDVFALAATLYHLLTNDHPAQNLWKFPKLSTVPQPLRDALRQALDPDISKRPTAREFREKLEECLYSQASTSPFVSESGQRVDGFDHTLENWHESSGHLRDSDLGVGLKAGEVEDARKAYSNAALRTFSEFLNPYRAPRPEVKVVKFNLTPWKTKITNNWAIWALVFALMPLCFVPISALVGLWAIIFGVSTFFVGLASLLIAILFGILGLKKAKELDGYGKGTSIAAILIATLTLLIGTVAVMKFGSPNSTQSFSPTKSDQPTKPIQPQPIKPIQSLQPQPSIGLQTAKPNLVWRLCWDCNGVGNRGACTGGLFLSGCEGKGYITCWQCKGHGVTPLGERCESCDGRGVNTCPSCDGRGIIICSTCEGTGKVWGYLCSWCKGSGRSREMCWRCFNGYTKCFSCSGDGLCWNCDGRGYSFREICYWCKGLGRCEKCFGNGWEVCFSCKGTGLRECSGCYGKGMILKD